MSLTTCFDLPLLAAGQAQKELFHNEALVRIDALLHPMVETIASEPPSADPVPGQLWIVDAAPTGAWSGMAAHLALWSESGWCFIAPREGLTVTLRHSGLPARWHEADWEIGPLRASGILVEGERVLAARQPPIQEPAGGAIVDEAARSVIGEVLTALRTHGLISS
ncbi:DUF2793 domain-containing protein [Sphingomonas turrisvirgatae]|uniref:DUF2793 domain-containing protein n=1 Tax=Sphingomonas turrisvirgatae TaxID=1888892 RepID=A0A1E3LTH4_9SPHN|nr:DUF2793 domain-containing protein [Sphingomonas turrisvirgatae]ODP37039.1 hypothetical protein BFL28_19165 [Sphingomonas turrisvirgatae]